MKLGEVLEFDKVNEKMEVEKINKLIVVEHNEVSECDKKNEKTRLGTKIIKISSRTRLWPPLYNSLSRPPLVAALQTEHSDAIFKLKAQGETRANQACVFPKIIKISSRTRLWPPLYNSPSRPPLVATLQTEHSEVLEDDKVNEKTEHSKVLDEKMEVDEVNERTEHSEDLEDHKVKKWNYKLAMLKLQFQDELRADRARVYTSFIKKITFRARRLTWSPYNRPSKPPLVGSLQTEHSEVLASDYINEKIESSEINEQNEHNEVLECDNVNEKIELKVLPEFGEINEKIKTMGQLFKAGIPTKKLSTLVTEVSSFMENQLQRKPVPESNWRVFIQLLELCYNFLTEKPPYFLVLKKLDFVADVLFCIQNSCAGCCRDDDLTVSAKDLLQIPMDILAFLHEEKRFVYVRDIAVLRRSLQFIGTMVSQSSTAKKVVWKTFNEENLFRSFLLCVRDATVQETTMMILYHCLTPMQGDILSNSDGRRSIRLLCNILTCNACFFNWGILILELVVYEREFIEAWYFHLTSTVKLLVLDIIDGFLECPRSDTPEIPDFVLNAIKTSLVGNMEDILKYCHQLYDEAKHLMAVQIAKLVSLLCKVSIHPSAIITLRKFPELVKASLATLKDLLLADQENSNAFSSLTSSNELFELMKEKIASHPSFCLKNNLIRLIGNLCAGSRENQDLVREYDGIPLLLDCCKLDYRNPYLSDWCILAIKNVLEDNVENQTVLACLTYEEKTVNSPFLAELGFTVEMKNERPVLKPKI